MLLRYNFFKLEGILVIMKFKDLEIIYGQMEDFMLVNGVKIKCMDLVKSNGQMVEGTRE